MVQWVVERFNAIWTSCRWVNSLRAKEKREGGRGVISRTRDVCLVVIREPVTLEMGFRHFRKRELFYIKGENGVTSWKKIRPKEIAKCFSHFELKT